MNTRYIIGDVFQVLATLDDNSVDLVLTSPPFLALRSYLPADHPDKQKEIGSEPTPAAFIDTLLDVVEALDRVLAPHGSICIELGDTYSGSGGAGGDYNPGGFREGQPEFSAKWNRTAGRKAPGGQPCADTFKGGGPGGPGWPLEKSLCLIPESFRWALVYGRNPFNGRLTPPWRARNVVRWCRPNPPVGALGDKFRPATSEMVVLCKSRTRYFDLDAVRTPYKEPGRIGTKLGYTKQPEYGEGVSSAWINTPGRIIEDRGGAPPLDWWNIPTQPYTGSHYATWPEQLCITPIKAMSPIKVCRQCGEPSRRIIGSAAFVAYQPQLAAHIKERRLALGISASEVNSWFPDTKSNWIGHWEDTTSQPLLPTPTQWEIIRDRLELDPGFTDIITPRNTVEYIADGRSLAEDERRTAYDRGGTPENGDRTKASRVAPNTWTDCGHNNWRPGVVLDPFAGSGTTLQVATGHGRAAIGIDIDESNADLAVNRIGPLFLTIEHHAMTDGTI